MTETKELVELLREAAIVLWTKGCDKLSDEANDAADELEARELRPVAFQFGPGLQYIANHWPPENTDDMTVRPLYAAPPPSHSQVPDGWQLMPVEITDEMIDAGADAINFYRVDVMRCYDAMREAAPQPDPTQEQTQ